MRSSYELQHLDLRPPCPCFLRYDSPLRESLEGIARWTSFGYCRFKRSLLSIVKYMLIQSNLCNIILKLVIETIKIFTI